MGNSNLVYLPLVVKDVLDEIGRMSSRELSAFAMGVRFSAQMIDEETTRELDKVLKEAERLFCEAIDSEVMKRWELAEKVDNADNP